MAVVENSTLSGTDLEVIPFCKTFGTFYDPSLSSPMSMAASRSVLIALALTCPFAAFFNGLTLLAFYKNPSLRKQANIFLISLAFVDLIKSTLASPLLIIIEARYRDKSQPNCVLTSLFLSTFVYIPSLFLLAVLNIERFIAINTPVWHRAHITKGILVKIAVTGCVLTSTLTIARLFTDAVIYPVILIALVSAIATLVFSCLLWRALKKRRGNKAKVHSIPHVAGSLPGQKIDLPTNTKKQTNGNKIHEKSDGKEDTRDISSQSRSSLAGRKANTTGGSLLKKQESYNTEESCNDCQSGSLQTGILQAMRSSSRKMSIGKAISSSKTHFSMANRNDSDNRIQNSPVELLKECGKDDHQQVKQRVNEHIEVPETSQQDQQEKQRKKREKHIEILEESHEHGDEKKKKQKSKKNKKKTMCIPATSSRYDKANRSEKKAAKIAIYLALGLFITAVIPMGIVFAFQHFEFDHYVAMKLVPALALLTALMDPIINIGLNNDIRKACKELMWKLKC